MASLVQVDYNFAMLDFKPENLVKLNTFKMPYGKYKGLPMIDLPEHYVVWCYQNGLPDGEVGRLLGELYEIKVNGLESLVKSVMK